MAEDHARLDDKFMRRIMWLLLTLSVTSGGGWIYTIAYSRAELDAAIKRIEKIEQVQVKISKSMSSIDRGVGILIALAEERNKQQKVGLKRQHYIFGEQKRRSPMIAWVKRQMMK